MANYIVDWQSGGLQGLPRKTSIVLPEKTKDTSSTSLTLTGRSTNSWGEIQQENFLKLMENFASNTPPANPTIGQLWYNSEEHILYMQVDELTSGNTPLYHPQSPARWAQIWPAVTAYASISEFNALAAEINRVVGAPSVSGTDPDIAKNQYGWGQTDLVPTYTDMNTLSPGFSSEVNPADPTYPTYPAVFDNSAWAILLSRLRKALRHIGQSESLGSPIGFINDGRPTGNGNALANKYNDFGGAGTLANILAGWNGLGLGSVQTYSTNTTNAINTLKTNRFSMSALSSQIDVLVDSVRTASWNSTKIHNMIFTFASADAAKAYFNSGGSLKFDWSHTGGSDTINNAWTTFLAAQTGLSFDYLGIRRGSTYQTVTPAGTTSVGFYDLTSTFKDVYLRNRQFAAYETITDGGIRIEARAQSSGSQFILEINVYFTESPAAGETIIGTTISRVSGQKASNVNTNRPGIAQPTATSGGSFTTP